MNVYDWDNTIYRGDSTVGLVLYAYWNRPKSLLSLPRTIFYGIGYLLHLVKKLDFKENLYHMFVYIPDMKQFVEEYTSSHMNHIKQWYRQQQKEDDVVISASPQFLISSFCKKAGIHTCMASRVDMHTGKYEGLNCHDEEKVRRFYERFPDGRIDAFYSDSRSDDPLARISREAYLVKGDKIMPWQGGK